MVTIKEVIISFKLHTLDPRDVECKGCNELREQVNKFITRLERIERVLPAVKQFYNQKKVNTFVQRVSNITVRYIADWFGISGWNNNFFTKY